jgi:formate hydrogenlyase subunit 3/multisubunit Na+/H+ antiporter MnhD subunit
VSGASTTWLLGATWMVPLFLLLGCASSSLRRVMPRLLMLAPIPGLAAALLAFPGPALQFDVGPAALLFELDRPGALLLGMAALLWIAAGAYARTYLQAAGNMGRFATSWLMALIGCLGAFVAADLASLYAMLALLTLGAVGLVIHEGTPRTQRAGGIYLLLALAAESLLLVGFVMLGGELSGGGLAIRDAAAALPESPHRDLIMTLLVAGFCAKAGLVPLHFWVPLAHAAAPVPASSVLSGAVIKVGIIGLIRFLPPSIALPDWGFVLTAAGFATAFYGVAIGLTQRHPKAVLAYSSVSQMGVVVAVLGMGLTAGDAMAPIAAAFYASHHLLAKGALFLAVGVIAATGARRRPAVLIPVALLCVGLGGLPFTGGAIAKYAVKEQLDAGVVGWLAALSAAGTTLLMLHFLNRVWRSGADDAAALAPPGLVWPWLVMSVAALALPWLLFPLLALGTAGTAFAPSALWSALWPVALGAVLATLLRRQIDALPRVPEGDIAAGIDHGAGIAVNRAGAFDRLDRILGDWPAAALAVLLAGIAFGVALAIP